MQQVEQPSLAQSAEKGMSSHATDLAVYAKSSSSSSVAVLHAYVMTSVRT